MRWPAWSPAIREEDMGRVSRAPSPANDILVARPRNSRTRSGGRKTPIPNASSPRCAISMQHGDEAFKDPAVPPRLSPQPSIDEMEGNDLSVSVPACGLTWRTCASRAEAPSSASRSWTRSPSSHHPGLPLCPGSLLGDAWLLVPVLAGCLYELEFRYYSVCADVLSNIRPNGAQLRGVFGSSGAVTRGRGSASGTLARRIPAWRSSWRERVEVCVSYARSSRRRSRDTPRTA